MDHHKIKTGFALCIAQSVLFLLGTIVMVVLQFVLLSPGDSYNPFIIAAPILAVFAILFFALSMVARKGKRGAAIAILVFSCPMYLPCLLSLIGSILMVVAMKKRPAPAAGQPAEVLPEAVPAAELSEEVAPAVAPVEEVSEEEEAPEAELAEEVSEEEEAPEVELSEEVSEENFGELPEGGATLTEGETVTEKQTGKIAAVLGKARAAVKKEESGQWKAFVALSAFFAVLLALSLASYLTGFFHVYDDNPLSYAVSACVLALVPGFLVYFGSHNPFRMPKALAIILIVLGGLGYAGLDALAVLAALECTESYYIIFVDVFVMCAQIATLFIYPYFVGKDASAGAAIGIVIAATVLLPFLSAIVLGLIALACIVLFAIFILTLVLTLLNMSGDSGWEAFKVGLFGGTLEKKEYTFTNDMGCTSTVYSQDGKKFYNSDGTLVGYSDDGGKTIRKP